MSNDIEKTLTTISDNINMIDEKKWFRATLEKAIDTYTKCKGYECPNKECSLFDEEYNKCGFILFLQEIGHRNLGTIIQGTKKEKVVVYYGQ